MILHGILFLLSACGALADVTYYLSRSTGSDSNSGLSPSDPWFSTGNLNNMASFATNTKFLFCYGEEWYNAVISKGSTFNGWTVDAYDCGHGTSQLPMISPGMPLSGWIPAIGELHPDTLMIDLSSYPLSGLSQLFVDEIRYIAARTPNLIDPMKTYIQSSSEIIVTPLAKTNTDACSSPCCTLGSDSCKGCQDLYWDFADDPSRPAFLVGDTVHARYFNYWSGLTTISEVPSRTRFRVGNFCGTIGFFVSRKLSTDRSMLDAPREFMISGNVLYMVPINSVTRSKMLAGTSIAYAHVTGPTIYAAGSSVTINNMRVKYGQIGINLVGTSGKINNCIVSGSNYRGILCDNANSQVLNTLIYDANENGIAMLGATALVQNNVIMDIGLIAMRPYVVLTGAIDADLVEPIGIRLKGINSQCLNNVITRVGFNGIGDYGGNGVITNNTITSAAMTTNDAGGIYSRAIGSQWINNKISNIWGNSIAYGNANKIIACYYPDEDSRNFKIKQNTCALSAGCIKLNYAGGMDIQFNTCLSSGFYAVWGKWPNDMGNASNIFANNYVAMDAFDSNTQNYLVRVSAKNGTLANETVSLFYNNYVSYMPIGTSLWQVEPPLSSRTSDFNVYLGVEPTATFQQLALSSTGVSSSGIGSSSSFVATAIGSSTGVAVLPTSSSYSISSASLLTSSSALLTSTSVSSSSIAASSLAVSGTSSSSSPVISSSSSSMKSSSSVSGSSSSSSSMYSSPLSSSSSSITKSSSSSSELSTNPSSSSSTGVGLIPPTIADSCTTCLTYSSFGVLLAGASALYVLIFTLEQLLVPRQKLKGYTRIQNSLRYGG